MEPYGGPSPKILPCFHTLERMEQYATGWGGGGRGGGVAALGDMPCLVCFVNELFINLGIPSDHTSFLHKQCNNFDAL